MNPALAGFFMQKMSKLKTILSGLLPPNKKQWKVFIGCVLVSTILWGLLRFSEEREDEVQIALDFSGFPADHVLVSSLPKSFPVKIKAQGIDLISRSFGFNRPELKIDLNQLAVINKVDVKQYVWIPKLNSNEVVKAIGGNIKSTFFPVDSIKLNFSPIDEKELVTAFQYDIENVQNHFILKSPLVSPYKVKVRGAKSILNKLDTIYTEKQMFDVLQSNLDEDFALEMPFGIDSVYPDSVRVFIGVEVIDKHVFDIPIKVENAPDSLEIRLFPNEVKVVFTCGTSELTRIAPFAFKAIVDFKDMSSSFKKLPIELKAYPDEARDIRIEPASVEYILKPKE